MDLILPLLSALAGAIIGSATSVATMIIQTGKEDRRARREFALRLALEDRKERMAIAEKRGGRMPPISVYLAYYLSLEEKITRGPLTAATLQALKAELDELMALDKSGNDEPAI